MNLQFPGAAITSFRAQTERQRAMPGVTRPSFRCRECGRNCGTKGRQKMREGWRCEACKLAREARKAIRGAKE